MNATWLNRDEYPFKSHYLTIDNYKLHFIDEGIGDPIVFVHGTPSWSFDFRNVVKALQKDHRCVAFDHIGFGLSDKPAGCDYSTQSHAKRLGELVRHLRLEKITLVVHDFGGPIGLSFAIENPDMVKRIVIMNSWLWNSCGEPEFESLRRILKSPVLPFLYRYFNFSPRFLLPSSFGDKKLRKGLLSQFTKPFQKISERSGPLAFAKSLLSDQGWFESLWLAREPISAKPTLLIWGMKDKFVGEKYLEKFKNGFSDTRVHKLNTCGHFPQEEEPDAVSTLIRKFTEEKEYDFQSKITVRLP
jgi:pimeloyl-ACP methyl ester carboxylesterase